MVLLSVVAVVVLTVMVAGALGSRDSVRNRVEWREHAREVRERNLLREQEWRGRFDVAGPGDDVPVTDVPVPELPRQRTGDTGPIPAPR